jgi:glucosamine--fructose-6-phosphate aminotransferase (isomerizing)
VTTVAIGGIGAPGVDLETVAQETSPTFTASHLGALSRLAQLAVALGAELGQLDAVPDAVATALEASQPAVAPPERGLEFVGAGPNQWTAAEGALKVREAARLFASGYSLEQLRHGPGFALGPADALICLDGGGLAAERLSEVATAVEAHGGAFVYRFAARELGEPLSVFPLTASVQRIACELAVQVDSDPDDVSSPEWNAIAL